MPSTSFGAWMRAPSAAPSEVHSDPIGSIWTPLEEEDEEEDESEPASQITDGDGDTPMDSQSERDELFSSPCPTPSPARGGRRMVQMSIRDRFKLVDVGDYRSPPGPASRSGARHSDQPMSSGPLPPSGTRAAAPSGNLLTPPSSSARPPPSLVPQPSTTFATQEAIQPLRSSPVRSAVGPPSPQRVRLPPTPPASRIHSAGSAARTTSPLPPHHTSAGCSSSPMSGNPGPSTLTFIPYQPIPPPPLTTTPLFTTTPLGINLPPPHPAPVFRPPALRPSLGSAIDPISLDSDSDEGLTLSPSVTPTAPAPPRTPRRRAPVTPEQIAGSALLRALDDPLNYEIWATTPTKSRRPGGSDVLGLASSLTSGPSVATASSSAHSPPTYSLRFTPKGAPDTPQARPLPASASIKPTSTASSSSSSTAYLQDSQAASSSSAPLKPGATKPSPTKPNSLAYSTTSRHGGRTTSVTSDTTLPDIDQIINEGLGHSAKKPSAALPQPVTDIVDLTMSDDDNDHVRRSPSVWVLDSSDSDDNDMQIDGKDQFQGSPTLVPKTPKWSRQSLPGGAKPPTTERTGRKSGTISFSGH